MKEIGISVYPDISPIEDIEEYFRLASKYSCTRVFSSMFSVEGTNEEIIRYFRRLIAAAHQYGMKVSLDVNPQFLKKIGADYDNISIFHDIGCDILRLDLSFGKEKDLVIIQNPYGIQIQLNASMGISEELRYLKDHGVTSDQLMLGHNFYPQRYTGLKWQAFQDTNKALSQFGYPIEAFVASHAENTHGVWDAKGGLPTVEMMRDWPIDLQARLLFAALTDNVLIGNAFADEEEFKALQEVILPPQDIRLSPVYEILKGFGVGSEIKEDKKIKVTAAADITENESFYLFDCFPHSDFGDSSEWIWRSRMGRFLNKQYPVAPKQYDQKEFPAGSVLIVNNNYQHYAGEVQIARLPLKNDGTRNLIGMLDDAEFRMLDVIKDGDVVRFLRK